MEGRERWAIGGWVYLGIALHAPMAVVTSIGSTDTSAGGPAFAFTAAAATTATGT